MKNEINKQLNEKFPWGLIKFSLLLFVIISMMIWYSMHKKEISLFGIDIKQNTVASFFQPMNDIIAFLGIRFEWNKHDVTDTTKQRILIIGDSMSGFLRLRLNDYCEHNGHSMYSVVWNSGNTVWYAETDTLDYFINRFNPTYIIIVLGSNELLLPKPEYRQKHIDKIIEKIGNIPFVWVGPPNWREDTGINNLILRSVGRKRFFPSLNLTFDRLADGAHPTRQSAYKWMDSIAVFLSQKAKYKIVMDFPDKHASNYPPTTMLAPLYSKRESKELNVEPEPVENNTIKMKLETQ